MIVIEVSIKSYFWSYFYSECQEVIELLKSERLFANNIVKINLNIVYAYFFLQFKYYLYTINKLVKVNISIIVLKTKKLALSNLKLNYKSFFYTFGLI